MNADLYQSIAPLYDTVVSPLLRSVRRDIATYIRFKQYRSIIDVCCGTGEQLRLLDGPDTRLVGIDSSLAMLAQAQQRSADSITFHLLDAEQSFLEGELYDCAIISFALHEKHAAAALNVFQNARRMVRPGGSLIIADFSGAASGAKGFLIGRIAIPLVERLAGKAHYHHYRRWLAGGGLEGFLTIQRAASDIICRPFGRTVLCCAVGITGPELPWETGLALLHRTLDQQNLSSSGDRHGV